MDNTTLCDYYYQLMVSSLMPIDEVESQFRRLETITLTSLGDLLLCFKHQWMYDILPIQMWNFHDGNYRTNNASEGEQIAVIPKLCPSLFIS
jgi:hypothetical protein